MNFNTIPEALQDLKQGKIILVTDDPDRENEGTSSVLPNLPPPSTSTLWRPTAKVRSVCRCPRLSSRSCNFRRWCSITPTTMKRHLRCPSTTFLTTGISAAERSITAMACVDDRAKAEDFRRPGHMFPLLAKKNGVLERNGHTEATVDLCRLAGLKECGLCCEIMREDGTMMRTAELAKSWQSVSASNSSPSVIYRSTASVTINWSIR